jgi:GMP synthase-like glutamine amidotransferase/tetratricopeptide (TPR) repeat protein/DNA-binding CsgD family transcriptional regulator
VRALALEHLQPDPVGVFGDVLTERGIAVDRVMLYAGEPLPDWREYDLIVAMGAGASVWQEDEFPWIAGEKRAVREAVLTGVPYFGVCFGVQLLADAFGGRSFRGPEPEIGVNQMFLAAAARHDPVFRGFPADLEVCEWHSNHFSLPPGAVRLASSPRYENQAIRYGRVAYGIQCHLEPSLDDIRAWLEEFPDSAVMFDHRHGEGSVDRLLDDYADFVPFLQETARQVFGRWLENALALGGSGAARAAAGGQGLRSAAHRSDALLGREAELARVDAVLASARHGDSAVLVMRGDAGIGKTALLNSAGERARGLRVVRTSGEDAAETEQPFAGLADLCRPLAEQLARLSPSRAQAAAAILDRGSAPAASDRFAAYAGAFDLLVMTAAQTPLLVLVDDAHLLDDASSEAISFIAGRLGTDGIALVVATESEEDLPAAEDLRLGGLTPPDARALLERRWGAELASSVADQVVGVAAGNPLALLEIPVELTPEQRAGMAPIEDSLPASAEWAFLRRLAALEASTRQALLVAALAGGHGREAVLPACRTLGLDADALAAADASELIRHQGGQAHFSHPLARTAVSYSALRADRRAAHAALAAALDGDAGTWHRARAAARPDESVATDLERLAHKARDQGAFATAARAFERAARLSVDLQARARRLLEAARSAHLAGHVNAALDHLDAAIRSGSPDPLRRDAEQLRGRIMARSGSAEGARDLLVSVATRCERDQPAVAAEMLASAVLPALRAGGPAEAVRIARRAVRLADEGGGPARVSADVALGSSLIFAGDYAEGAALVDAAAEASNPTADLQERGYLGAALVLAGRHGVARRVLGELVDEARAAGAVSVLPYALIRLADVALESGDWSSAAAALREAQRLARETGQVADYGLALGALAWLDAVRGQDDDCLAHVEEALELATRLGSGSRLDRAAIAIGLLELGRNQPQTAIPHLEKACRLQDEQGWSDAGRAPHRRPDLIEALALAGRHEEAREALALFQRDAERTQRPSAFAAAARCTALLAHESELDAAFEEALRQREALGPFEQARTELLYGSRLIDAGRMQDASRVLAAALETFERLGAEPWAARARSGILAAGGTVPRRHGTAIERLAPRELEVALAAARGGSSLEIAERLSLGLRTVELTLASAAIKLGAGSQDELTEALRPEAGVSATRGV